MVSIKLGSFIPSTSCILIPLSFLILVVVMLVLNHCNAMKLNNNQFNYKRNYYKVWFPLMDSLRFHTLFWYILESLHYEDRFRDTHLVTSFDDLVLSEYHDLYFKRVDNMTRSNEYRNCLNFLLDCSERMLRIFAKDVLSVYPELYECIDDVMTEIENVIYPYKCNK